MNGNKNDLTAAFNAAQFLVESLKDGDRLPSLGDTGLCWLLSDQDEWPEIYDGFYWLFANCVAYVAPAGKWTEARMNLLAFLSVMQAEDFI